MILVEPDLIITHETVGKHIANAVVYEDAHALMLLLRLMRRKDMTLRAAREAAAAYIAVYDRMELAGRFEYTKGE